MKNVMCILALGVFLSAFARADEVEQAIKQGSELYKKGSLQQAATQLEYAASLIREQRGGTLAGLLPKPLSGWTSEDAESQTAGAAMFGGGTSVSKTYVKGDAEVSITITTDSPLLQTFLMMFTNPMILQSQGGKLRMIKGHQVVFNESGATSVVNSTYLVQVEKNPEPKTLIDPDLLAYIEAIDFEGIKNMK